VDSDSKFLCVSPVPRVDPESRLSVRQLGADVSFVTKCVEDQAGEENCDYHGRERDEWNAGGQITYHSSTSFEAPFTEAEITSAVIAPLSPGTTRNRVGPFRR